MAAALSAKPSSLCQSPSGCRFTTRVRLRTMNRPAGYPCGGETAVICVSLSTEKDVALLAPNLTAVAPVKFLPVMTTVVPPAAGPVSGLMSAMNGPGQLGGGGSASLVPRTVACTNGPLRDPS
jgi:hypothetical protein